jgi:plastocyanin
MSRATTGSAARSLERAACSDLCPMSSSAAVRTPVYLSVAASWSRGLLTSPTGPGNGGQAFSHTFTTPGPYKYFCIPHEPLGMVATITVT